MTTVRRPRAGRLVGGAIGLALAVAAVVIGGPGRIWGLLTTVTWAPLAGALIAFGCAMVVRGVRLHLLLQRGELQIVDSVTVATAAQAAALFAPARIGELALPWLLTRAGGRDASAAVGTLLAARGLDLSALGVWAAVGLLAMGAGAGPAMVVGVGLLVGLPMLLPAIARAVDRAALRILAPRGVRGRRWARRARRVRREFSRLATNRPRLAAAYAAALGWWGLVWLMTFLLLRSMGLHWPWWMVVTGSSAASVASWVPIAAVGAVGPLEAGWTAAFHALGVPLETAAASGIACHLWSLLFTAVAGVAAWLALGGQAPPPVDDAGASRSTAAR